MLDLKMLDLGELSSALEDHSPDAQWLLDPEGGELWQLSESLPPEEYGLDEGDVERMIPVEPSSSDEGYVDMEDFIARVPDLHARDLLQRAIAGRGAFRRFKDTLLEFPELREAWFAFHDARASRRAIEWLRRSGLVSDDDAERAIAAHPDPPAPAARNSLDPFAVAADVAADLRELYGDRLRRVILFGSWARGDAHPESDIDLLVVLDEVESSWDERDRMSATLSRHSLENDTVVTAIPVSEAKLASSKRPLYVTARQDGRLVA